MNLVTIILKIDDTEKSKAVAEKTAATEKGANLEIQTQGCTQKTSVTVLSFAARYLVERSAAPGEQR